MTMKSLSTSVKHQSHELNWTLERLQCVPLSCLQICMYYVKISSMLGQQKSHWKCQLSCWKWYWKTGLMLLHKLQALVACHMLANHILLHCSLEWQQGVMNNGLVTTTSLANTKYATSCITASNGMYCRKMLTSFSSSVQLHSLIAYARTVTSHFNQLKTPGTYHTSFWTVAATR